MKPSPWLIKIVLVFTTLALTGVPAMAQAAAQSSDAQSAPQNTQASEPQSAPQNNGQVDPSAGPKTPVPSSDLPEAPSAQEQPQTTDTTTSAPAATTGSTSTQQSQQQTPQEPQGAATARRGPTAGGAGSKPAGMAIAPAKQKQTRSLLIKLGAIAAAGAALGTVYALSRGTPSTPPGATSSTNH